MRFLKKKKIWFIKILNALLIAGVGFRINRTGIFKTIYDPQTE